MFKFFYREKTLFNFFSDFDRDDVIDSDGTLRHKRIGNSFTTTIDTTVTMRMTTETPGTSTNMRTALRGVEYIAQHIKNADKDNEVS